MYWIFKAIAMMAVFSSMELDKKIEASPGPACLNVITNNFIMIIMIAIYFFLI